MADFWGFCRYRLVEIFAKRGGNPVWDEESHPFRQLFASLGAYAEWLEWEGEADRPLLVRRMVLANVG